MVVVHDEDADACGDAAEAESVYGMEAVELAEAAEVACVVIGRGGARAGEGEESSSCSRILEVYVVGVIEDCLAADRGADVLRVGKVDPSYVDAEVAPMQKLHQRMKTQCLEKATSVWM